MAGKKNILRLIGEEVRTRRKRLGMTQLTLAEQSGCHINYIGLVERGKRNMKTLSVEAIATALGMTAGELLTAAERRRKETTR